jgi:hypothetical protein
MAQATAPILDSTTRDLTAELRRSEFSQRKLSAAPYFARRHLLF